MIIFKLKLIKICYYKCKKYNKKIKVLIFQI